MALRSVQECQDFIAPSGEGKEPVRNVTGAWLVHAVFRNKADSLQGYLIPNSGMKDSFLTSWF